MVRFLSERLFRDFGRRTTIPVVFGGWQEDNERLSFRIALQKWQRIKRRIREYTQAAKLVPMSKSGGFGRGKDWRERAAVSAIG